ncbi:hypothetical protein [Periweissella beninensis]|uniref:hypothetical protein n=1 Tax=Periweissella beninensis TaxID=504936 RepID=UPI001960EFB3|nr:hypothetical protein [Periweissella beninensis]MBM7543875.1 hypothetical protein [Periweissella beninensis]
MDVYIKIFQAKDKEELEKLITGVDTWLHENNASLYGNGSFKINKPKNQIKIKYTKN